MGFRVQGWLWASGIWSCGFGVQADGFGWGDASASGVGHLGASDLGWRGQGRSLGPARRLGLGVPTVDDINPALP